MDANDLLLVDMVVGTCGSSLHFSRNRKRGNGWRKEGIIVK